MQKSGLFALIREEVTRAFVFGVAFVVIVSVGFTGVAYAANGGIFGELLNKILVTPWDSAVNDGKVKNAAKFDNKLPSEFVQVSAAFTCPSNQCIYKLTAGAPECR